MKGKLRLCLIGLAGCVICAAAWAVVIQSGTALADKPKDGEHSHDGDDGGGATKPLEVTGCATFRDDFFDAVQSDGAGLYCDAEITLMVDKWGVKEDWHRFDLHPYNKRDLWLDFRSEKEWEWEGEAEAHEPPFEIGLLTLNSFHATEFLPRPELLYMNPGDTADVRMVMLTRDPVSRKRYFIYFGDRYLGDIGSHSVWSGSNFITVTAGPDTDDPPDGFADSWTFESTGAGSLVFVDKGSGSTQTRKGVFYLPFAVTFVPD